MLLTENMLRKRIQKLIIEASKGDVKYLLIESKAKKNKIFVDNVKKPTYVSFGTLLESADKGIISYSKVVNVLSEDLHHFNDDLLAEGVLDTIKSAYEKGRDGVLKIKDNISDKIASVIKKVNEKYLEYTVNIFMLAQKGKAAATKVVSMISKFFDMIGRFKEKHPILYRAICAILIMVLLFIVALITSKSGQAGTGGGALAKLKGAKGAAPAPVETISLDDTTVTQVYGCMKKAYKASAPGGANYQYDNSHKAIRDAAILFKKSAQGGQPIDPTQLSAHASECLKEVEILQDIASSTSSSAASDAQFSLDSYVSTANKVIKMIGEVDPTSSPTSDSTIPTF